MDIGKAVNTPLAIGFGIIGIYLGVTLISSFTTALWGTMMGAIVGMSTLSNFTFSGLFVDNGIFEVLLSVGLLIALFSIVVGGVLVAKGIRGRR